MKRYFILVVLFSVFVSACSQDDTVDPNLTKDLVGTYKGETIVEKGYSNRTDWKITRVSNTAIKASTLFNFISTSAAYQSYTEENVLNNLTVIDDKSFKTSYKIPVPGDTLLIDAVGILAGQVLTVTSNGKNIRKGDSITPIVQKYTKE